MRSFGFSTPRPAPARAQRGFTLIEILVVVVILGLLASLIAPNVIGRIGDSRIEKARHDVRALENAIEVFRLDNFEYPATDRGLRSLLESPAGGGSPYLKRLPQDPWGKDYLYLRPGSHGEFDVYSLGRDGALGGEGEDADIGNWNIN